MFDDLELRHEWRPKLAFRTPGFDFTYYTRISEGGEIFDQVFEVSKLLHCIRPTLSYRARRNEVFLEIRIPGLSGKNRGPGRPRSEQDGEPGEPTTPPPPTPPAPPAPAETQP